VRVVTAIDPAGTDKATSDETGIVTAGVGGAGWCEVCGSLPDGVRHIFVMDDRTDRYPPEGWASAALDSYDAHGGDAIVAEVNFGADMVKSTVSVVDPSVVFRELHASRGKRIRAEPVAALCGQKDEPSSWGRSRVHIIGYLPKLEGEMTGWDATTGGKSPNALDALVWAVTDLVLDEPKRRRRGVRAA
jgi:phage terminase large subunit-like protein